MTRFQNMLPKLDKEIQKDFTDSVLAEELAYEDIPEEFRDSFMFEEKKEHKPDFWADTDISPID